MTVEEMREQRGIAQAVYMQFIQLFERYKGYLFCFFEGDDNKYFSGRITNFYRTGEYHFLKCKGKNHVLHVYNLIVSKNEYKAAKTKYFVDRDFDVPISAELREFIYETPCYSIENFYTSTTTFKNVLKSEFGLSELDDDFQKCVDLYNVRQFNFHEATTLINAWISIQRDMERSAPGGRLNLRKYSIDEFVNIGLDSITANYDVNTLESRFPDSHKVDDDILRERVSEFQNIDRQKHFRGKYEIEFLRKFLFDLKSDAGSNNPRLFSKRINVPLSISRKNIISELSQYAETSTCLIKFLSSPEN